MKNQKKVQAGKKSRQSGKRFENLVRKDLEKKGWIVDKWTNNVSDYTKNNINLKPEYREDRKLVPAKNKFNPYTKQLMMGSGGFPDFIAFRLIPELLFLKTKIPEDSIEEVLRNAYEIIGVESKMDGKLRQDI